MLNASIGFWNENKPRTGFHSTLYTREYPELATERLDFAHNRNSRPWFDIYFQKVHKGEEIEPVELVTDTEKEEFIRSQQHKLAKKSRTRRTAEPRK